MTIFERWQHGFLVVFMAAVMGFAAAVFSGLVALAIVVIPDMLFNYNIDHWFERIATVFTVILAPFLIGGAFKEWGKKIVIKRRK